MVDGFAAAEFTQNRIRSNPITLFQMMVMAACDGRPFTSAASGSEEIWEMMQGAQSVPPALASRVLFTPHRNREQSQDTIHHKLASQPYRGCSLATDISRENQAWRSSGIGIVKEERGV